MKRNKLSTVVITALVTGSLLAGGHALAKGKEGCGRDGGWGHHGYGMHDGMKGGMHHGGGMGMVRGLDLTAEQKKAMIDIGEKYENDVEAAHQQMRESRKALREAMHTGEYSNSDEVAAAVEPAAEAQSQAMKKMVMLRAQQHAEVHNLLTPEQREQLQQRHDKKQERRQQKMEDRQEG